MADLQVQIPQHVERKLDHLFHLRGDLTRGHEQQVDIGMGGHFATPVAAHRHHGHLVTRRPATRCDMGLCDMQHRAHKAIGQMGIGPRDAPRGHRLGFDPGCNDGAPCFLCCLKALGSGRAERRGIRQPGGRGVQRGA